MNFCNELECLSLTNLSCLDLCLSVRPEAHSIVDHLKGASLGSAPAFTANIRLGWINLQGINTQAYYKPSKITTVRSFVTLGQGVTIS
jgi:hypothetical protein